VSPVAVRLTGGLADAQGKLLADPMPFEIILKGPDGATLFRKFASIGPEHPLNLPVPAMSAGAKAELVVRDLVLGTSAVQPLEPSVPSTVTVRQTPDLIGGEKKMLAFFSSERKSKGPVTIVLDQGQEKYRPAAEKMAALVKKAGREARVVNFDPADVRPYYLRWYPLPDDLEVVRTVTNELAWAERVDLDYRAAWTKDKNGREREDYTLPNAGYAEWGPRLRHDADVILFGTPADNRIAADLAPWLRRKPTDNYPATGGFFVHYLWSPFRAGYDAVYVGCRDVAGAEAAVACLSALQAPEPVQLAKPSVPPLTIRGGQPAPLEDMAAELGGTPVLNIEFAPSGKRLAVATFSYADWLFALDSDGKVVEHAMPPEMPWWPNWYRWGRWVTPVSDTQWRVKIWNGWYDYEFGRGWTMKYGASLGLEDKEGNRVFMGGSDRLVTLDPQGKVLWTYEDGQFSTDLTQVRQVQPRCLSADRSVLLVSAYAGGAKNIEAPSILGLDAATGKVLWNRNGIPLVSGKIVTLGDRFLIVADNQAVYEVIAQSGQAGTAMSNLTGNPDWVLEVPGKRLLIVENSHFTRNGPACRAYLRPLSGGADVDLDVPGRTTTLQIAPDKQSVVIASTAKRLLRFAMDGTRLWQIEAPACNIVRFSPDGKNVVVGGWDGVVRLFDAADGKLIRETDLNVYNKIAADAYANQPRMGELPVDASRTPQPPPPEPSYLKTIPPRALVFGPNLAPPEKVQTLLKPAGDVTILGEKPGYLGAVSDVIPLPPFQVKAGTTYLVELLDVVGIATNTKSLLRLQVSVAGAKKGKNLPCVVRLPVDEVLKRRRFAFRADSDDQVTLTLRPILPQILEKPGYGQEKANYGAVETSAIPIVVGDVVVSAMKFPGKNVLFDGGPAAKSKPFGTFVCTLYPMKSGDNSVPSIIVKKPDVAFQLVNGQIANGKTDWDKISQRKEGMVDYADAVTKFREGTKLSAVVVYEDISGPVMAGGTIRERATTRYAVEVHKAGGDWVRVGAVTDNSQLVNIFPCPDADIDGIRYLWAGRYDALDRPRIDAFVRTAQIEAYMPGNAIDAGDILDTKKDDGLNLEL
jgi:outer membrane protein assembly factor BamB